MDVEASKEKDGPLEMRSVGATYPWQFAAVRL
jgi:hypothetical protein